MKTLKIKISPAYAQKAAVLLWSLDIPILMTWTEEGFMGELTIYLIIKIDEPGNIPESLRIEKLKENSFIKYC